MVVPVHVDSHRLDDIRKHDGGWSLPGLAWTYIAYAASERRRATATQSHEGLPSGWCHLHLHACRCAELIRPRGRSGECVTLAPGMRERGGMVWKPCSRSTRLTTSLLLHCHDPYNSSARDPAHAESMQPKQGELHLLAAGHPRRQRGSPTWRR